MLRPGISPIERLTIQPITHIKPYISTEMQAQTHTRALVVGTVCNTSQVATLRIL